MHGDAMRASGARRQANGGLDGAKVCAAQGAKEPFGAKALPAQVAGNAAPAAPFVCARFDDLGKDNPNIPHKLGIMGGTFDPIHVGHLACAEQVCEAFGLDGVVFMPAGDPWMKSGRGVTRAQDRYAMVAAAVAGNPTFDVSDLEIRRPGRTYTVDTLRALREHYPPNVSLHFISGADAMLHILEWRDAAEVGRLANLIAVTRPGYALGDARLRYMRTHASIARISQMEITALGISSTDLREKARAGRSIRYLVPEVVADYISAHGLYAS